MPVCGAKNCSFSNPQVFWQKHHCHYCNVGLHGCCAVDVPDVTPRTDACPACYDELPGRKQPPALLLHQLPHTAALPLPMAITTCGDTTTPMRTGTQRGQGSTSAATSIASLKAPHRLARQPLYVHGTDITIVHPMWEAKLMVPPDTKQSSFWLAFHVIDPGKYNYKPNKAVKKKGGDAAVCNFCGTVLMVHGGTSVLRRHLESNGCDSRTINRKAVVAALAIENQKKNNQYVTTNDEDEDGGSNNAKKRKQPFGSQLTLQFPAMKRLTPAERKQKIQSTENACKDAFAMMSATMNLPLSTFDNPVFHHALGTVIQCAKLGGKTSFKSLTIRTQIFELANEAKMFLQKHLQGHKVAATTDHWTSCSGENYASLMVHWIDNFTLCHSILAVYLYEGSTTANRIADDFNNKLSEWELTGRVPYLVTDTEAKMNAAGQLLAEYGIEHIYCLDHLLQLVAIMAYDADVSVNKDDSEDNPTATPEERQHKKTVSKGLLKDVRRLVTFFNKSTQAQAQLRQIQKERNKNPVNVVQDVATRWWSTLAMLDRLFELRESLVIFADRHSFPSAKSNEPAIRIRMLTRDEWELLNLL